MSKTRKSLTALVLAAATILGVTSCTKNANPELSPMPDTASSGIAHIDSVKHYPFPDVVHIKMPEGWKHSSGLQPHGQYSRMDLNVIPQDSPDDATAFSTPGLAIDRRYEFYAEEGESFEFNVEKYRDAEVQDYTENQDKYGITRVKALPEPRTIGNEYHQFTAYGFEYVSIKNVGSGEAVPEQYVQVWYLAREDGLWAFYVKGFPEAGEVPQELLDALDTIFWMEDMQLSQLNSNVE